MFNRIISFIKNLPNAFKPWYRYKSSTPFGSNNEKHGSKILVLNELKMVKPTEEGASLGTQLKNTFSNIEAQEELNRIALTDFVKVSLAQAIRAHLTAVAVENTTPPQNLYQRVCMDITPLRSTYSVPSIGLDVTTIQPDGGFVYAVYFANFNNHIYPTIVDIEGLVWDTLLEVGAEISDQYTIELNNKEESDHRTEVCSANFRVNEPK